MFADRRDAGRQLARRLLTLGLRDTVILGLPRGGVPVAREVADALGAPLDVLVVRKLGVPGHSELAFGAVGEGGVRVINRDVLHHAGMSADDIEAIAEREGREVEQRLGDIRQVRPRVDLTDRTAVIVDDGIATGASARAACQVASARGAGRVVVAVPVAPPGWKRDFRTVADECVALETPRNFHAVGVHYEDFGATSDAEVLACLN